MLKPNKQSSLLNLIGKNNILRGTFILTLCGFITRFLGFYNRIFLSEWIGSEELGIYQLVMPVYMMMFAFTTYGNEVALTKLTSECISKKNPEWCKLYVRICLLFCTILGIASSVTLFFLSEYISVRYLHSVSCKPCLQILCLGIPFMSIKGALHGYFLGSQQSGIHGMSDCIEQLTKIGSLYVLSSLLIIKQNYTAAFASWGIVCGELLSCLYSIIIYGIQSKKTSFNKTYFQQINPSNHSIKFQTLQIKYALRTFFKTAIPLTTNRLLLTTLQSVEAIIIPCLLLQYYNSSSSSLSIYGLFTGIAFPCIMFPSTITNSLSTMLLPTVSAKKQENAHLSILCEKSIAFCVRLGIFSMICFYFLGSQLGVTFFHNEIIGQYITWLSMLCPFLYVTTTLASMLNGLGFATHNLILSVSTTIIRILFIYIFIPRIGIRGYVLSLFCSYLLLTLLSLFKVCKLTGSQIHIITCIIRPFIYMLVSFLIIKWSIQYLSIFQTPNNKINFFIFLLIYIGISFIPYLYLQYNKPRTS